ncbi:hypothetical protein [Algoriphagus aquimarinus]|uniref:Lipoprotein n=1 Tax=Algoriphagus aquimarinus TaxID=237018 RepID=A0A1I0XB81_9BACT|nr:hypothetical protein [Algoriphagus aquimarinus]SFA98231.1 hypothetical protein SAMN04489723_10385 [Algoriphagus aquimarinus]
MRKILFGLIVLLPILMSCEEDESKVIQTDLALEAEQLFETSSALSESAVFALFGWNNYQTLDSLALPGCPTVTINKNLKLVTLNFLSSTTCESSKKYARTGEIQLQYDALSSSPDSNVILSYNNYKSGAYYLEGSMFFSQFNSTNVLGSFNELIIRSGDNNITTQVSGDMIHVLTLQNGSLTQIESTGEMEGINPVGRTLDIKITSPKVQKMSCFKQNLVQHSAGQETWSVERGNNSKVSYSVSYETSATCTTSVFAILPDGRKLLLNPSE